MASQTITLESLPRGQPFRKLPREVTIPRSGTASEIYQRLAAETGESIHRIRVTKGSDGQLVPNDKDIAIQSTGLLNGSKIYVKDLGPQIGWRTVFLIEYAGPLIIHPIIYLLRPYLYKAPAPSTLTSNTTPLSDTTTVSFPAPSTLQTISLALVCIHFVKRELETVFVHRFSASTMPFRNLFKNSAHYWVLSGLLLAYIIYSPTSRTQGPVSPLLTYPGLAFFAIGQLGNLYTHLVLSNLRTPGTRERGIPRGLGFDLVTCPNYTFEFLSWLGVIFVTQSWATVLFAGVSVAQMAIWAKKKERDYRREFGDKYKKKRYAMLPGVY